MGYKEEEFERLWNGPNPTKSDQFRSLMKSRLGQLGFDYNKENAKQLFLGNLKARQTTENILPPREPREESDRRRPPRRGPRRH